MALRRKKYWHLMLGGSGPIWVDDDPANVICDVNVLYVDKGTGFVSARIAVLPDHQEAKHLFYGLNRFCEQTWPDIVLAEWEEIDKLENDVFIAKGAPLLGEQAVFVVGHKDNKQHIIWLASHRKLENAKATADLFSKATTIYHPSGWPNRGQGSGIGGNSTEPEGDAN